MAIIPIRKPRPFAGARGYSLKELYSAVIGTKGITQLNVINPATSKRYNTEVFVLVEEAAGNKLAEFRTVLYSRMTIVDVFKRAGFQTLEGDFKATAFTVAVKHPLESEEVLRIFNGKHACDFTEQDIKITHISGSLYTVEALPKSLGYIGKAEINIGEKIYVPLVPTEHALVGSVESTVEPDNVKINDQTVNLKAVNQFKSSGIIFKEFNIGERVLTYMLNTNEVSLNVTITGKEYEPSDSNLNETVQPSRNTFILAPFIEASVDRVAEAVNTPSRIRATTWVNNLAELDAIFKVKVNGVTVTLDDLASSEKIEVLKVGNVIDVTNLTYVPMNIQLTARTISLPAMEDRSLTFLTIPEQDGLVEGYEVYNLQLAAADLPLTKLTFKHHNPSSTVYNQLLSRLNVTVGLPPKVTRDMFDTVIAIETLNHDADNHEAYERIISIDGDSKAFDADIYANGLKFLNVFSISAEDWAKLVDSTELNKKILTIQHTVNGIVKASTGYSFNDLQNIGVVDTTTQEFVFAFVGYGDYEGMTTFTYPEVPKRHLAGTSSLFTSYDVTTSIAPRFVYVDTQLHTRLTELATGLTTQLKPTPESSIILPTDVNGFDIANVPAFKIHAEPTEQQLKAGKVEYSFNYALVFTDAIKPLLDYAMANPSDVVEHTVLSFINKPATGFDKVSLSDITITTKGYATSGFDKYYHDPLTKQYYAVGTVNGVVNTINLNYNEGLSRVELNSPQATLTFDPDSHYGHNYTEIAVTALFPVIHEVKLMVLEAPTFKFPLDMVDVVSAYLATAPVVFPTFPNLNVEGKYHYVVLTNSSIAVNVVRDPTTDWFNYAIELDISASRLAELVELYDPEVTIKSANTDPTTVKIGDIINHFYNDRCFFMIAATSSDIIEITLDVDGIDPHYASVVSVLKGEINVIPAPQDITILLDETADLESQTSLLTHIATPSIPTSPVDVLSPFDIYKAPLNPITELWFDNTGPKKVVDGKVIDIDEAGLIGVEFRLFLTEQEVSSFLNPNDLVATINKVGTEWSLELTRDLFRQQAYVKDGEVHLYLLFKVNPDVDYNGDYQIELDWDGLGTDDSYLITGTERNKFYKQSISFQLDLEAVYLPVDLESARVWWVSNQKDINTALLDPEDLTYPKDYEPTEAVGIDSLEFSQNGNIVETKIYQDTLDPTKLYTLYMQTDLTDEVVDTYLPTASITIAINGGTATLIDPVAFKNSLYRSTDGVYFLRRVCTAVTADQSLVYTIDLDADGKRYQKTVSTLLHRTVVIEATMSPAFIIASNQMELLAQAKAHNIPMGPDFDTMYIDSDYITVNVVDTTTATAEAIVPRDYAPRLMPLFIELQITQEALDLNIDADTVFSIILPEGSPYILAGDQTVYPISGIALKARLVTYNGKMYLPIAVIGNLEYQADLKLDVDSTATKWKASTSAINANYSLVVKKDAPALIWAANQAELMASVDSIPEVVKLSEEWGEFKKADAKYISFPSPTNLKLDVYDNLEYSKGIGFVELVGTLESINEFITGGKLTITPVDSDAFELVGDIDCTKVFKFTDGKYYIGIPFEYKDNQQTSVYTTSNAGQAKYYTDIVSTLELTCSITRAVNSSYFTWAVNQTELLNDLKSGLLTVNHAGVNASLDTTDKVNVVVNGIATLTRTRDEDDNSVLKYPLFAELMGGAEGALERFETTGTVVVINEGVETPLANTEKLTDKFKHNGKWYLVVLADVEGNDSTVWHSTTTAVDVDGDGVAYYKTQSTMDYACTEIVIPTAISCEGALNYAGVLNIEGLENSTIRTQAGVVEEVISDEEFLRVLRTTLGLEVIELTDWVDPNA